MNQRLKDIMLAHGLHKHISEDCQHRMEMLAELIVKECVQTLRDNTPVLDENESVEDWNKGYIRAMLDCEHHITEHFGIK